MNLRLFSLIPDSFSGRHAKLSGLVWTATAQNWNKSRSHKSSIMPEWVDERAWWTKYQSSLLNFYLWLMQWLPVLAPIYSLPLRSEIKYLIITLHLSVVQYLSDMWRSTFLSARRKLAPLQKSRQNHRYVKTLALSGMIFRGGVRVIQYSVNVTRQGDLMPEVVRSSWNHGNFSFHSINKIKRSLSFGRIFNRKSGVSTFSQDNQLSASRKL